MRRRRSGDFSQVARAVVEEAVAKHDEDAPEDVDPEEVLDGRLDAPPPRKRATG